MISIAANKGDRARKEKLMALSLAHSEDMISTNTPTFSAAISVPKDLSQLSPEAYTAGIVEAILDGMGFPARVTAHSVATPEHPLRTTILIKLDKGVMQREEALGAA